MKLSWYDTWARWKKEENGVNLQWKYMAVCSSKFSSGQRCTSNWRLVYSERQANSWFNWNARKIVLPIPIGRREESKGNQRAARKKTHGSREKWSGALKQIWWLQPELLEAENSRTVGRSMSMRRHGTYLGAVRCGQSVTGTRDTAISEERSEAKPARAGCGRPN
jgi:hypothetical protein